MKKRRRIRGVRFYTVRSEESLGSSTLVQELDGRWTVLGPSDVLDVQGLDGWVTTDEGEREG